VPDLRPTKSEQARVLTKAVLRASNLLGINQVLFSLLLGIEANRMVLLLTGRAFLDPLQREWRFAISLVKCYTTLCKLLNDDDPIKITAWMTSKNRDLGKPPIQLLNEPNGIKLLEQFLTNYIQI
jgi:hypothetical protein